MHRAAVLPWLMMMTVAVPLRGAAPSLGGQDRERVFFAFDDHSIPWKDNLQLTLVQAQKYKNNPVVRCGQPGSPDAGHAILYGTVLKIDGKFRMWYLAMSQRELVRGQAPGYWRPMCYAESDDGIHWVKPALGLVEFNGNKQNNICLIESPDADLTRVDDFLSVLYEPDDPDPKRRYKCAFIAHVPWEHVKGGVRDVGRAEKRLCAMVCAASADGLGWKVLNDRPAVNEKFEVSSLYRFQGLYFATGQQISPWSWLPDGRSAGRVMTVFRSSDLADWPPGKALAFARAGQRITPPVAGQQSHMGAGLWNRGNVLVGLYGMWQDGPPAKERPPGAGSLWGMRIDLGLIVSNDGIHFREPVPGFKVLAHGQAGQWDSISLLQGHAFVNDGDRTMIWYSHWDNERRFRSMEIGLATLRRDGFGYLSRHHLTSPAHFVTRNIAPSGPGTRLRVNVEGVSAKSPLIVELLDKNARPVPGYSGDQAARVDASDTHREIVWPSQRTAAIGLNQPFSVKVRLPSQGDVRVYAVYVDSPECGTLPAHDGRPPAPAAGPDLPVQRLKTPEGIEYGLWNRKNDRPAPTLIVLASTIDETLANPYYRQCGNQLAEHGFVCVSVDLPCHGARQQRDEPPGLAGWARRAHSHANFVSESNDRLSRVLDHLIRSGVTLPGHVACCGTSRGGFLALHFAAHDPRVSCVAAFAPVTDLEALREFRGLSDDAFVASLSVTRSAPSLAGRPVWLVIGDQDQRVGTDRTVSFARRLTRAALDKSVQSAVQLHVLPEPRGHTIPRRAPELAADWVMRQLGSGN